jgi:hypothetical protein
VSNLTTVKNILFGSAEKLADKSKKTIYPSRQYGYMGANVIKAVLQQVANYADSPDNLAFMIGKTNSFVIPFFANIVTISEEAKAAGRLVGNLVPAADVLSIIPSINNVFNSDLHKKTALVISATACYFAASVGTVISYGKNVGLLRLQKFEACAAMGSLQVKDIIAKIAPFAKDAPVISSLSNVRILPFMSGLLPAIITLVCLGHAFSAINNFLDLVRNRPSPILPLMEEEKTVKKWEIAANVTDIAANVALFGLGISGAPLMTIGVVAMAAKAACIYQKQIFRSKKLNDL